ncbi:unnamed protein product [Cunninghamella blakesleeana]
MAITKYLILLIAFYIAAINAQSMCGGKKLTPEQSVDAWKCVGKLRQKEYSFDEYTAVESSGSCTCKRIGPLTYDRNEDEWNDMNQCAAPGGNHQNAYSLFHYDEGEACSGTCSGAWCHCWVLTYECKV